MARRKRIFSGAELEGRYGYARAVAAGDRVLVSGTAPIWPDGACDPDPGVQARRCLEIIEAALREAGAELGDVVRTRMFVTDAAFQEAVGAAHAKAFASHPPATSMVVVAGLLDERWKVEIEAEAIRAPR
ncbi:MAG TPA: RidA family protein [Solirubrobacterales bacterium]|nr:RidA family protein [Solirubrobacterales bacterium]